MADWSGSPVLTCRSCRTELPSDAKFCWQCGTSIYAAVVPEPELDEETAVKTLHSLITPRSDVTSFDKEAARQLLARFPQAVTAPVGKERRTALHRVAWGNAKEEAGDSYESSSRAWFRKDAFDVLLEVPEVDVNARDWVGETPLHVAIGSLPQLPVATENHSADILDPFMLRIQLDVITTLLKLGADPNAANVSGETPMHFAAQRGRNHVLYHLLCVHGGNPLALDKRGWTPEHYAHMYRYPRVISLIHEELEDRARAGKPAPLPEPLPLPTDKVT